MAQVCFRELPDSTGQAGLERQEALVTRRSQWRLLQNFRIKQMRAWLRAGTGGGTGGDSGADALLTVVIASTCDH